jgi:predicted alpha/beta hydrolase
MTSTAPPHPPAETVSVEDIVLPASDGFALAASLFKPAGDIRSAILINSATAVPRKIYRSFASYLVGRGHAVVTYDYRGTGGSRPASLVGFETSMTEWAARDVTSAVAWMRTRFPVPLRYVGHSFGGQALGLLPNNAEVSRALFVAAQAGSWSLMTPPENYRVYAFMNFIGAPLTRLMGYAPGKMGIGEDLPKGVFLQWARWVSSRRYYYDDPTLAALTNYPNYRGALRALSFSDDPWATRPAVELLCSGFTATRPEIVSITPASIGAKAIGHFGFFRPEHRDTLWRDAADWLLAD